MQGSEAHRITTTKCLLIKTEINSTIAQKIHNQSFSPRGKPKDLRSCIPTELRSNCLSSTFTSPPTRDTRPPQNPTQQQAHNVSVDPRIPGIQSVYDLEGNLGEEGKAEELGETWGGGLGEGPRRRRRAEGRSSREERGLQGRGMGPAARVPALKSVHHRRRRRLGRE